MSNISSLFCTPDQGRRLKELVPSLTSVFVWYSPNFEKFKPLPCIRKLLDEPSKNTAPALTLQELRVFISHHKELRRRYDNTMNRYSLSTTAPELADWVIERLEESKP